MLLIKIDDAEIEVPLECVNKSEYLYLKDTPDNLIDMIYTDSTFREGLLDMLKERTKVVGWGKDE